MTDAEVAAYLFGVGCRINNSSAPAPWPKYLEIPGVEFSEQEQNAYRRLGADVWLHWVQRGYEADV